MDGNERNQITCEHELVYQRKLKKGEESRFKREDEITLQAKNLAKKILKKRQNEFVDVVPEDSDSIQDRLPSITNSIPPLLSEQDEHSNITELVDKVSLNDNQPLYPHSAFCQLSSSSSEVSEMSFDVSKYDAIKLPIIHQTKYHDTVEIINESIEPIAYDQTYPLTSKALLERTAYQRQQELLENQILRLELEKKMVSVLRLKECMKKTEASLGCHRYERNLRGQSDLQWEQLGLSQRVDVSRLGKHKEAILSKYRKLYKERDDNMKTRLQRKLKIVEKLLKEEKLKHGLKKIDEKRKSPKLVELKKVESEIIHVDLEEEIQIDEELAEEHVVEEEEKIIVPLEIEPIVDTKKKRKSRREKHESKTSEDGIKSKEKKKDKGAKSKSPVEGAKKGKSKSKSRSLSKSKRKSKKDKKKPKSREASAISEDYVEPEVPENQFPTLLKLFEEWEDKRKTYDDQMELLSVETGVEWKPDIITFKDFKPQNVYKQRLHIVNTSSQRLHFRLAAILMDDDMNCEVLEAGPVDAIKLGPGMSWTMDVKLYPVENTSEVTGNIKFITTHLDTTRRQFLVKFVATPCRAEPYIQPMKLMFPTLVFWSSLPATRVLKVINNGGLECRLTLRKLRNENSVGSSNVYISSIEQEENIEDQNNYLGTEVNEGDIPAGEATYLSDDVTNIQGDDNNEQDEVLSSDWESSPCLWFVKQITEEIFDDVFAVFRIQFRHFLYVPPHAEISIPVKFIPRFMPFVGKIYEKYEAIFEEEDVVNSIQDILIYGETEDIPIHVSSSILDLKLCFLGGNVQQDSFRVYSTTKHVCALSIKVPPSLAKHIQVDPKETILQSYSSINFIVRLILKSDFCSYLYFDESTGILEFPIEIYISGLYSEHPPPLIVTVIALVTSCVLSLNPNYIDFGQVSTHETVTTELEVINHSMGIHEFSFLNLPNSINIEPGGGSGKILPGETLHLQVLYSPSLKDLCLGSSCSIGSEGQHNFTLHCVTAIELANGLQRLSCLQQVKPISQRFSALNKASLSNVETLPIIPEEFQHDSMTSLTVKAESEKNVFISAQSITTNSQKDEERSDYGFIEESSTIQYEIDKNLATTDVPSLKQLLDDIIEQSNSLEDSSPVWNIFNSFEIGNFTHEGNLELKDNLEIEENNLELDNEGEIHTNVKSLQNNESNDDKSELSRKIEVNLEEEDEMKDREFQEIIEVDEIELSTENKSETMSVSTQHTTEFDGMYPVVHVSAYVVDPLVEFSAQKIIFPPTPCESFFISHIYLRSKKQEGCHCGRLKPNAHKFIARFEFKWKCDQISVEPRRGEIAMDQSIKISIVFKPKLRKSDILTKAKEIKTEKLYEEAIKAFVESHKNKPKKKKKGKQDNKKSKSGKKKSVTGSKLNKKEKQKSVKNKKSATENKVKDKRKSGGKLKEKVKDEIDNKKSRKSSKSKGKQSVKQIADSGDYTDIEEITLPDIVIDPNTISIDEEDIKAAETYLLKYYDPNTIKGTISCLVETAIINQERRLEVLECEVICPIIPPNIVVQASHCLDFGPTAIGTNTTQALPILNVAENTVPVVFTPLNPYGAFTCPVKHRKNSNVHIKERCKIELEPEHSLNLPVKFTPRTEEKERMNELFEIKSESTIINVMLRGRGVYPKFEFTPEFALYTLEAAPGKKVECKITVTNSCESPLNFHLKQEFLKEGSELPESKPAPVETSNKQGKQPKMKQKKEKFQKMRPTVDLDFIDWLKNEFQLVDEQNLINPVFDINDNFTVDPEGNYVLKITFCPPPHDIVKSSSPSSKSPRKSKGKSNKNEGSTKDKKVKKLESISPRKGKKDSKSRKPSSKGKMESKSRIFAVKYVISLGRLIDVKEWIIIGIVKDK